MAIDGQIHFHIHGDNIVECERTVDLIQLAFGHVMRGPLGSLVCPVYEFDLKDSTSVVLTLYPGFGRWDHDILEVIRRRGGVLREVADTIVTKVNDGVEVPLLAIEYCGALPAGNQAWQRSGRAYSFGKAQVPYLYVAELAGYELDEHRARKSTRLPNPAVAFSYVSFSLTNGTPTIPVFVISPGADEAARAEYSDVFGETELLAFIRGILTGEEIDVAKDVLRIKALSFVEKRAASSRAGSTLTPKQWQGAYECVLKGRRLSTFLIDNARLTWAKTAYIAALTPTVRSLMRLASQHAIGLTARDLPMCLISKGKRPKFAEGVEQLYSGRLQPDFLSWLGREAHLSICWVMGFKPRGDDARPDRGLPPLTRMLVGDEDLLTVVYGPAPPATWPRLDTNPRQLLAANGLWEAILDVSDAVLVDSATDATLRHGYVRSHWRDESARPEVVLKLVTPRPLWVGEQDVDTVLHLLLAKHGADCVFEGLCNPPGGDWSGISLLTPDQRLELRWLSLPRVSGAGGKRPDHVFQLFSPDRPPIVLSVESKDVATGVESGIGPRLKRYVDDLVSKSASIERDRRDKIWRHSTRHLDPREYTSATAVAFVSESNLQTVEAANRSEADLLMRFRFPSDGDKCEMDLIPVTALGADIAQLVARLQSKTDMMCIKVAKISSLNIATPQPAQLAR